MPRGCWEKKKKKVQLPKSTCSSAVTFMEKILGEIGLLVAFGGFWRPLVMKDCTPCACTLSQQGLANVLSCLW